MASVIVRLPIMIQDPSTGTQRLRPRFVETVDIFDTHFSDGPASQRVVVIDQDPVTQQITTSVPLLSPIPPDTWSRYHEHDINDPNLDIFAADFIRTSTFGTVYRTLQLFEAGDALNRSIPWASGKETLTVFTRCGRDRNARYVPQETALKFYYFPSSELGRDVFTALSRDIVAHETGHAMLDAIAPDLLKSFQPDAFALHEAVADLAALLLSFQSTLLVRSVLESSDGALHTPTAFSNIAEEFGSNDPASNVHALRSLINNNHYDRVDRTNAHLLSTVLSGALYTMFQAMYNDKYNRLLEHRNDDQLELRVEALQHAADKFRRMFFRALDYLPAGGVIFADVGRAILAADQSLYPEQSLFRAVLRNELARRGITHDEPLTVTTNYDHSSLDGVNIFALKDIQVARLFVDRHRAWLKVPVDTDFTVTTLQVTRETPDEDAMRLEEEIILKISWEVSSSISNALRTVGTTLVLDPKHKRVRALLCNAPTIRSAIDLAREEQDINAYALSKIPEGKSTATGIYPACALIH